MAVLVNGEPFPFREGLTIGEILKERRYSYALKTVFLNGKPLKRETQDAVPVKDGDEINVIHLMSGG